MIAVDTNIIRLLTGDIEWHRAGVDYYDAMPTGVCAGVFDNTDVTAGLGFRPGLADAYQWYVDNIDNARR